MTFESAFTTLLIIVAVLIAYAVALEMRKRYQTAAPSPEAPVNPCAAYHSISPIAASSFKVDDSPRTSVIYRCERCSTQISAVYMGTFSLDELARVKAPESLEELWKR